MEIGADIINDVSGGSFDGNMFNIIKKYDCPYILTHSRGTPQSMLEKRYLDYGDDMILVILNEIDEKINGLKDKKIFE